MPVNFRNLILAMTLISCSHRLQMKELKENYKLYSKECLFTDTILNKLKSEYELLIYSNIIDHTGFINNQYFFIGYKKSYWSKIVYKHTRNYKTFDGTSPFIFSTSFLNKRIGDSILHVFIKNNFFKIQEINEGCDTARDIIKINCGSGSKPYDELGMIYKDSVIRKIYNNPKFFDRSCCPGNSDRQIFIKCYEALKNAANNE
jgi:hypothetical protein